MDACFSRRSFIKGLVRVIAAAPLLAAAQGSLAKAASSRGLGRTEEGQDAGLRAHPHRREAVHHLLGGRGLRSRRR
ncbi:MAG: hypothetical protein MZW92_15080 [Comamonadaceae bacterium]|nr:hypothetical protein [Comamonadaceae bacterium]